MTQKWNQSQRITESKLRLGKLPPDTPSSLCFTGHCSSLPPPQHKIFIWNPDNICCKHMLHSFINCWLKTAYILDSGFAIPVTYLWLENVPHILKPVSFQYTTQLCIWSTVSLVCITRSTTNSNLEWLLKQVYEINCLRPSAIREVLASHSLQWSPTKCMSDSNLHEFLYDLTQLLTKSTCTRSTFHKINSNNIIYCNMTGTEPMSTSCSVASTTTWSSRSWWIKRYFDYIWMKMQNYTVSGTNNHMKGWHSQMNRIIIGENLLSLKP